MAISNFVLPTGLEVSGTSTFTGSVGVSNTVSATNLTASGDVSGSAGNFVTLFKNGSAVLTSADLSAYVIGSTLTGTVAFLTASNVFTETQVISGNLLVRDDLTARSGTLNGDLTVKGNLTVNGTTTYIDSTTVNIGDRNISLATGSTTAATLDGAGLDLGNAQQVQWYYDHDITSWSANVGVNVATGQKYSIDSQAALEQLGTSLRLVSGSSGAGQVAVGTLLGTTGVVVSGSQKTLVTAPVVQLNGVTELTASAAKVLVGGATTTTASLLASNEVQVGSLSTGASYLNGVAASVIGATAAAVSAPLITLSASTLIEVSGATKFANSVSGTTAQFTVVTGSSISSNEVYAGSLVAPSTNVVTVTAAGTSTLDTFQVATYGGAKYLVKAKDATTVHSMEALVSADGTVAQLTPYASTYTGVSLFSLSASNNGTTATISIISAANALTASVFKTYLP